jgi:hypothetical protein
MNKRRALNKEKAYAHDNLSKESTGRRKERARSSFNPTHAATSR